MPVKKPEMFLPRLRDQHDSAILKRFILLLELRQ
jgi:hypothetical protein